MTYNSPTYKLCKRWINFIDLQQLDLSYTAIGIYVCLTANKQKEFTLEELIGSNTVCTADEVEFALEELLEAELVEFFSAAVTQRGAA